MPSGRLGKWESPLFFLHLELLFDFSIRSILGNVREPSR